MARTGARLILAVATLTVTLGSCGGRAEPPVAITNDVILASLSGLPVGEPVAHETYGYEVDGKAQDEFFTEVRYERPASSGAGEIVRSVRERLGDGWEVTSLEGSGCCLAATFSSGPARVELTTWDDGFDVTVAAQGAVLDDTRLAF